MKRGEGKGPYMKREHNFTLEHRSRIKEITFKGKRMEKLQREREEERVCVRERQEKQVQRGTGIINLLLRHLLYFVYHYLLLFLLFLFFFSLFLR